MKRTHLSAVVALVFLTSAKPARSQPLPAPSCADPTPFALAPLPPAPDPSAWTCFAASWLDRWQRGRAKYNQIGFGLKAGGLYGRTLPSKHLNHLAVGGEIRLFSWLNHETDVPPAIEETADAVGLGETRLFVQLQLFDSKGHKIKFNNWHLRGSVLLRITLPTDSTVGRSDRYPLLPWHLVLGPPSRDYRYALMEMVGITASADWKDRFHGQLHWTPMVWGIVGGGSDRFLTHLHILVSGRPSKYIDLGLELFGVWGWSTPYGTSEVVTEGFGIVISGLMGQWTAQLHVRMSMGDPLETYGFLTVGIGGSYRFK
jgi:hypothetical protein